jgi:5'-nucleotidase
MLRVDRDFYGVSGSPADCVYLGIRKLFESEPDLVVSGINRGANLGQDVYYSGTVSAAREACMLGIPALAVSLDVNFSKIGKEENLHFATAGRVASALVRKMMSSESILRPPAHTLLNLNVPDLPFSKVRGVRLARQGFRFYSGAILQRKDHRGKDYFWVGGQYRGFKRDEGSDCDWVARGYASLTPLKLDSTDHDYFRILESEGHLFGKRGSR